MSNIYASRASDEINSKRLVDADTALLGIIAATMTADAILLWISGIHIWIGAGLFSGLTVLIAVYAIYSTIRPNERISTFALISVQLIVFTNSATVLIYIAATSNFPLADNFFASADRAIGFDWLSFFWIVRGHPLLDAILEASYYSILFQIGALMVALNALGRQDAAREFAWLFAVTLLTIAAISWAFPAEGAWAHYGVSSMTSAYYLPDFYALRNGTMRAFDVANANGIIQFPSFHATLGLLIIIASRETFLFAIFLPLNIVMIISAITAGGHYFVDILAGLVIAAAASWGNRRIRSRLRRRHQC